MAVVWSLVASVGGLRQALDQAPDVAAALESEFRELVPQLPPTGVVGYLERYVDADAVEAVRMHYLAQYALVPRIVERGTGPEFLIVARGTEAPGGDFRLEGYFPVANYSSGHRVYRRFVP